MNFSDLRNQPWEKVIDPSNTKDVNKQAEAFDDIMESTLSRHAPLRKTKIRPHFQQGLSLKTKALMRKREFLRRQTDKCNT